MPHGDLSDVAGFLCLGTGLTAIFAPHFYSTDIILGPVTIKSMFGENFTQTAETDVLLKLAGTLLIALGLIFYINRWNKVNAIAGIAGSLIISFTCGKTAFDMDGGFVLRPWWILSSIFCLMVVHLFLFPNPVYTSAMLREKEKKKAEEKAKKPK